jgi:DnaA family protein
MEQLALRVRPTDWARFATFVAGPNAAVVDALSNPRRAPPRVAWLWGRPGTAKTHLLQASCAAAGASGATAAYFDLRGALRPGLLDGCEALSLVCLDSIEAVAGHDDWNAAIFRLHTLMQDARGRLLVASAAAPATIDFRLPDLRSRLLAGDTWQLLPLDDDAQVRALGLRAAQRGLELSEESAQFLLRRLPRDMHTLCRVLDRLDEASLAAQRRLTVPFLRQALAAQAEEASPRDA